MGKVVCSRGGEVVCVRSVSCLKLLYTFLEVIISFVKCFARVAKKCENLKIINNQVTFLIIATFLYFVFREREAKQKQKATSHILVDVKAGVEHLADKLQHLKAPKGQVPQAQLSPTSDEYILDLLGLYFTCIRMLDWNINVFFKNAERTIPSLRRYW